MLKQCPFRSSVHKLRSYYCYVDLFFFQNTVSAQLYISIHISVFKRMTEVFTRFTLDFIILCTNMIQH